MISVFGMLNRISQSGGSSSTPEWLASHPNPENRSENFQKEIDTLSRSFSQLVVNQEGYYRLIDGMVFGQNPREGFFHENHFYHPELEFEFLFPSGWYMVNQKRAVAAVSPDQDAVLEISQVPGTSSASAARQFFDQEGLVAERLETGNLNGLTAVSGVFRAETEQGAFRGKAEFVEYKGNVYQLLGFGAEQNWSGYQTTIVSSIGSFRRLTDSKILQMQPMHLKMITVDGPVTLAELTRLQNSHVQLETLAIINQVQSNASFKVGERVKMVIGERFDMAGDNLTLK
jgi:predicted Zn-dependent protease